MRGAFMNLLLFVFNECKLIDNSSQTDIDSLDYYHNDRAQITI